MSSGQHPLDIENKKTMHVVLPNYICQMESIVMPLDFTIRKSNELSQKGPNMTLFAALWAPIKLPKVLA